MFELPELTVIAGQMNATLAGKQVAAGHLGTAAAAAAAGKREHRDAPRPSPHRFVWYDRTDDEFARLTDRLTIGAARAQGRFLLLSLEPGYVLLLFEWGGRIRYVPAAGPRLPKYHLWLELSDGSALMALTQMWGGVYLVEEGTSRT